MRPAAVPRTERVTAPGRVGPVGIPARSAAAIRCAIGEATSAAWVAVPAVVELEADPVAGTVLAVALDQHEVLAFRAGGDSVRLRSLNHGTTVDVALDGGGADGNGLSRRLAALTAELDRRGRPRVGLDAVVLAEPLSVDLGCPMLELTLALALAAAADWSPDPDELADACRAARRAGGRAAHGAEERAALAPAGAGLLLADDGRQLRRVPVGEDVVVVAAAASDRLPLVAAELERAGATTVHIGGFGRRDHVVATGMKDAATVASSAAALGVRAHLCRPAPALSVHEPGMFPLHLRG